MINRLLKLRWRQPDEEPPPISLTDLGEAPMVVFTFDELAELARQIEPPQHRIITALSEEACRALEGISVAPDEHPWARPFGPLGGIPVYRGYREVERAMDHVRTWNEAYPDDPIEVISIDDVLFKLTALAEVRLRWPAE